MDETDPYFCMQNEVIKSLGEAKKIYSYLNNSSEVPSLKQIIKNIEWDLMDLEETIAAVEKRPSRFHLSEDAVTSRRQFLTQAQNVIKHVKSQLSTEIYPKKVIDFTVQPSLPPDSLRQFSNDNFQTNQSIEAAEHFRTQFDFCAKRSNVFSVSETDDPLVEHKRLLLDQDNRLDHLGTSISTLKGMSRRIGDELSDQVVLLDDFSDDMSRTETRLDAATKKTARILRLNTDRRQWCAIFSLLGILIIILILLAIL